MQFSTFTWIITAMLAGHALAMPRGGGNAANAGNGNSNGKLVPRLQEILSRLWTDSFESCCFRC